MKSDKKYPGMSIGLFRRSDGNGGSNFDKYNFWERIISGVAVVMATTILTTAFNWYVNTKQLNWRMARLESATVKLGTYVWGNVNPNPNSPCPFDDFQKDDK